MYRGMYPHYTNEMQEYPRKPNELKHIYDIEKDKYVTNEKQCCYYSTVSNIEEYSWKSMDTDVLLISPDGLIETVSGGTTHIQVTSPSGVEFDIGVIVYKNNIPKSRKGGYVYLAQGDYYDILDVMKHGNCPHTDECLFESDCWDYYDEDLRDVKLRIKEINVNLKELKNVKDSFLNGEIIYHHLLEDYYLIDKKHIRGRLVVQVRVRKGFSNGIGKVVNDLKLELRSLNRELFRLKK